MIRKAIVMGADSQKQVEAYLPQNYRISIVLTDDEGRQDFLITGHDNAGWTLDGYVIPRLASGLISAKEL